MIAGARFDRRHPDWLLLGIAAACGLVAWVFVKFGSEVTEGELTGIDAAVRQFAMARQSPAGRAVSEAISFLGSKLVLAIIAIAMGWWISGRSKTAVVLLALCAYISAEYVSHLKEGFGVLRPPIGGATSRSLSFPSGHVSGATAIVTLLDYVALRHGKPALVIIPVSVLWVSLIALSRIYLDKHWLSDTIGGVFIGLTLGLAGCAFYEWISRRRFREEHETRAAADPGAR